VLLAPQLGDSLGLLGHDDDLLVPIQRAGDVVQHTAQLTAVTLAWREAVADGERVAG